MKALAKRPEDRYENAEEFIAALESAKAAIVSGANGGSQDTAAWAPGTFAPPPPPAPLPPVRQRGRAAGPGSCSCWSCLRASGWGSTSSCRTCA